MIQGGPQKVTKVTEYEPPTSLNNGKTDKASADVDNGLIQIPPTSNIMARKKSQEQMLGSVIDLNTSYMTNQPDNMASRTVIMTRAPYST